MACSRKVGQKKENMYIYTYIHVLYNIMLIIIRLNLNFYDQLAQSLGTFAHDTRR